MLNADRSGDSSAEEMGASKPSKAKRAIKTGVVLAAAGLTALAISRRMKSGKGKKKSRGKAGARKVARKVARKARSTMRSATRGSRRTSRAR